MFFPIKDGDLNHSYVSLAEGKLYQIHMKPYVNGLNGDIDVIHFFNEPSTNRVKPSINRIFGPFGSV